MYYKNVGTNFFRFVTDLAFDRHTDNFIVARPLQWMQQVKNAQAIPMKKPTMQIM